MPADASPWYADGLRFGCTRCGACCRGEGYVWVTVEEAAALAEHLDLEIGAFGRRYLRLVGKRLALVDGPDGACVFWEGECSVYPARPRQCRTFPFWRENLAGEQAWKEAGAHSPGIGRGRHYPLEEIERLLSGDGATRDAPAAAQAAGAAGPTGKEHR